MNTTKSLWLLLLWFVAAAGCIVLLKLMGIIDRIDMNIVTEWLRGLGVLGGLLYIAAYALRPLVLFPATPLTLFGGYTFGTFWGTVYDVIGAGLGALLSFAIARKWGRDGVQKLLKGKKLMAFDEKAARNGFAVVLYMRIMPFFPFDGVSYGAGLSRIRFRDYCVATWIGVIPGAVIYNYFGASLHDIGSPQFYWAVALYAVFALLPFVLRYIAKGRGRNKID